MFFQNRNLNFRFVSVILFAITFLVGGFFISNVVFAEDITAPTLSSYNVSEIIISPNGDEVKDVTSIDIAFSEPVHNVYINIKDASDSLVKTLHHWTNSQFVTNPNPYEWDGTNTDGSKVSDGLYTIEIIAADTDGNSVTDTSKKITVDTTIPAINLTGTSPVDVTAGNSYTDAGATASDNVAGDITANIITVNTVNVNAIGTYTITYNVFDTAGNAATQVTRTVNVIVAPLSSNKDITSFSFPDLGAGVITGTDIAINVPYGTDVTALVPTILISGETVNPLSGVAQDFTNPITYTVTAEDSSFQNYTVTVTVLPLVTHTITASAGEHGSISPSGDVSVAEGEDQVFIITPDEGYHVTDVIVDDNSVGAITSHTFSSVTATHTISVSFAINIVKSHGSSGSRPVTPAVPANITTPDGCGAGDKFSTKTGRNCNAATSAVGQVLGAEKFNFTKFLKFKSLSYKVSLQGAEVMELQKLLNSFGNTLVIDGKFGPKTNAAVIKFQIANGLKDDGVIGALTRAVLNK